MYLRKKVAMEQQRSKSPASYIDYLLGVADELDPVRDAFVELCDDGRLEHNKKFENLTGTNKTLFSDKSCVENYKTRYQLLKAGFNPILHRIKREFENGTISLDEANKEILVVLTKYKITLSSLMKFEGKIEEPDIFAVLNNK